MKNSLIFFMLFIVCSIAGFHFFNETQIQDDVSVTVLFNHNIHVTQHKIKCKNCHVNVNTQERAGIPNIETCVLCHSKVINPASEEEKQVYKYVKENIRIPWQNYFVIPDYVIFSHRRHVKLGSLDCILCHGDMAMQTSPTLINYQPFIMKVCFDCHKQRKISTDCSNCHH